ncbi:MAG: nicotinamide riboside transporter PnuC [Betaproteobacteria bacterium]
MSNPALEFAGGAVSWLELIAFALALAGIALNALEIRWGWPLSALASLLYGWLFLQHRLYGDGALQAYFAAVAVWGWYHWGKSSSESAPVAARALPIRRLDRRAFTLLGILLLSLWLAVGWLLSNWTDSDVPWWDAAPTAGSLVAQALVVRKVLQAWHLWIAVNAIAIALFAFKSLWLTAILYALLLLVALAALLRWRRLCA